MPTRAPASDELNLPEVTAERGLGATHASVLAILVLETDAEEVSICSGFACELRVSGAKNSKAPPRKSV